MLGFYVDIALLVYLAFFFYFGRRRRPLDAAYDILILALTMVVALMTFRYTAGFLTDALDLKSAYTNVIGFFMNAFIFKALFVLISTDVIRSKRVASVQGSSLASDLMSGVLAIVYGLATIAIIFASVLSMPIPDTVTKSIGDSYFVNAAKQDPFAVDAIFQEIFGGLYYAMVEDFNFMTVKSGQNDMRSLGIKTTEVMVNSEAENRMLVLVNLERSSRGLEPLAVDEEARRAARDYGEYLFKNGIMSHTDLEGKGPADRMKDYNTTFLMAGENLARAHDVDEAHTGLMNSSEHQENILRSQFSRVGIGAIDAGMNGIMFVQEFLD